MSSGIEREIERLVAPALEAMGYAVVRVKLIAAGRRTLQIMAEPADGRPMGVDDCAEISRAIGALLDVEDPIAGAYDLEVSSPGIDRPLVRAADFARFAGHEARIETRRPLDGRRRYRGRILGLDGDRVRLAVDGDGEAAIPLAEIDAAKLVLTDRLIAEAQKEGRI